VTLWSTGRDKNKGVKYLQAQQIPMSVTSRSEIDLDSLPSDYKGQIGDGSRIPTKIESENTQERCPYCGNWYKKIGQHWSQSSCPYPPVSEYKMRILLGMMLGDGSLNRQHKTASMNISMSNKTFLEWLNEELDWLTKNFKKKFTFQEVSENISELNRDSYKSKTHDHYQTYIRAHPSLEIFKSWYKNGKSRIPDNLSIPPTALKMWYVSDGGLHWSENHATVSITSVNEIERGHTIIKPLEEYGFTVKQSCSNFVIGKDETDDFFDLIGEAPPGFEYKWCHKDRKRYDTMFDKCKQNHYKRE
jgi:hypothetical protein